MREQLASAKFHRIIADHPRYLSPLAICTRISNSIQLIDPTTLQVVDLPSTVYWREPFPALAQVTDLIEFLVLDIEPSGLVRGKHALADAQVTFANSHNAILDSGDGSGGGDGTYHTRTHLGAILQPGDTVLGYFLSRANFNNEAYESLDAGRIPDVMLVKKTYPNRRKKNRTRNWKLKSIAIEAEDVPSQGADKVLGRGALGRRGGLDQQKVEKDYEMFLRELEEDPELRGSINLYKAALAVEAPAEGDDVAMGGARGGKGAPVGKGKRAAGRKAQFSMDIEGGDDESAAAPVAEETDDEDDEDFPDIDIDELLGEFVRR